MNLVVLASMAAAKEMVEAKDYLEQQGHIVIIPEHTEKYASGEMLDVGGSEGARRKIKDDLIRKHYNLICGNDAVLTLNAVAKRGILHYIGGNTFLEMGFAYIEYKRIFLLFDVSDQQQSIAQEVEAFQPVILNGDLDIISSYNACLQISHPATRRDKFAMELLKEAGSHFILRSVRNLGNKEALPVYYPNGIEDTALTYTLREITDAAYGHRLSDI